MGHEYLYSQTENNWFNSWISQIIGMDQIYVSYMVSLSSIFGAVFFLLWGTYSDTLRTPLGAAKTGARPWDDCYRFSRYRLWDD